MHIKYWSCLSSKLDNFSSLIFVTVTPTSATVATVATTADGIQTTAATTADDILTRAVPVPTTAAPIGCKTTSKGREYNGSLSTTRGGLTCQRWDSNYPHSYVFLLIILTTWPRTGISDIQVFRVILLYTLLQKEVHIDFAKFPRWPWVNDPDLGSCRFCQIILTDQLIKLKWPEVSDLGTEK